MFSNQFTGAVNSLCISVDMKLYGQSIDLYKTTDAGSKSSVKHITVQWVDWFTEIIRIFEATHLPPSC